jgi:uncharacterized protein (DUF2249 family)/hemerythrin-like domain-containing protein
MSGVSHAIHEHHQGLSKRLTEFSDQIAGDTSDFDSTPIVQFLQDDLLPHAMGEEKYLYPAVAPLIKEHGNPTATMSIDHEYIASFAREIETAAKALNQANEGERTTQKERLQRLLLQLETLLTVHLEKEERVYLPLFEQHLPLDEQERILAGMHEDAAPQILDVRTIPPAQRHPLIFQTFEALNPGETFQLVNDHDPKPLYYQFKFEREGLFSWDYLESGPVVWRVRIGKR